MDIKNEIYVSTYVESDGPIPGENSMLSFGSAAFTVDGQLLTTFSANLELLPGAIQQSKTMEFLAKNPSAWKACRKELRDPQVAMKDYVTWLKALPGKPVFVGYPATYDFMFVYWYLIRFTGESPFSFHGLDIKSYAMAMLKTSYKKTVKKNMPKRWFSKKKHNHLALDDAIEQGELFCAMLAENLKEI